MLIKNEVILLVDCWAIFIHGLIVWRNIDNFHCLSEYKIFQKKLLKKIIKKVHDPFD